MINKVLIKNVIDHKLNITLSKVFTSRIMFLHKICKTKMLPLYYILKQNKGCHWISHCSKNRQVRIKVPSKFTYLFVMAF